MASDEESSTATKIFRGLLGLPRHMHDFLYLSDTETLFDVSL